MKSDIVRIFPDAKHRQSLTSEQQVMLPKNPVSTCELTDADLEVVQGGNPRDPFYPMGLRTDVFDLGSVNRLLENNYSLPGAGHAPSTPPTGQ